MLIALTRPISPSMEECALAFQERQPIDVTLATQQHEAYCTLLRELGVQVVEMPLAPDLPDAVFVEDTTVVVDELAVLTRPLLPARQQEVPSMAEALAPFRPLHRLEEPATLEGGDVLRIGRTIYVGRSVRTNDEGIRQLAAALAPFDYRVVPVEIVHCLHLKSAVTFIGRNTVLANPEWLDLQPFAGLEIIAIAPEEPHAANALLIEDTIILPASFPKTRAILERHGFRVRAVDVSEVQKAEGGVTCCNVLLQAPHVL